MAIYFYSTKDEPYGCFSNFSRHGIQMDGVWWPTTEHYFQAQKFAGTEHVEAIRQAQSPKIAAGMGRSRKRPLRPDWESVKVDIMRQAVLKKFETHEEIRSILLATGSEEIVENAPSDYFWGCGKNGSGNTNATQTLARDDGNRKQQIGERELR